MKDNKLNYYKKWLEKKGYDFEDDELWMEDYITEHKWRDIIQLIDDYISERQESNKTTKQNNNKVLLITNISNIIIAYFKWLEGKQLTANHVLEIETFAKEYIEDYAKEKFEKEAKKYIKKKID